MKYFPPKWLQFIIIVFLPTSLLLITNEFPFLIEYYILQGLFAIGIIYIIYRVVKKVIWFIRTLIEEIREARARNKSRLYTRKEVDRAFIMFHDLSKGVKPHVLSYPQYKSLYYSPYRDYFLSQYYQYFEDLKRYPKDFPLKSGRPEELANYIYKKYPFWVPQLDNRPF